MSKSLAWVLLSLALAPTVRAAECPPVWMSQSSIVIYGGFDPNSPPTQTELPENPAQFGYHPAAVIKTVALANGMPLAGDVKGWCRDIGGDPLAFDAHASNPHVISDATGSIADGGVSMVEQSSTSGGGAASQSSALVQMGLRDILHVNAAGTDLVPITLRRTVNGTWTLDGGEGDTLDRFINRAFVLTLWEHTQTTFPESWMRRLVIDDHDLNLLNGEETYDFEVLPGKDLILSLYAYGQASCIGDSTFGDPPALYHDCYSFMDFGGQFGSAITFGLEPGPGVTITSEGGFTQYVPEPGGAPIAALLVLGALARRRV
jgi:hypothetical protein